MIADWIWLVEAARGESCPLGQRRGPAASGEDTYPSPDHKSVHTYLYNSNNPEKKPQIPRVDTSPQGVEIRTQLGNPTG